MVLKNNGLGRSSTLRASETPTVTRTRSLKADGPHILTISPSVSERSRLESILADVWSQEVLPLSFLGGKPKGDHLGRATSIMRKLSATNLSGSLGRRSGSLARRTRAGSYEYHETPSGSFADDEVDNDATLKVSFASYLGGGGATVARSRSLRRPKLHPSIFVNPSEERLSPCDASPGTPRTAHTASLQRPSILGMGPRGGHAEEEAGDTTSFGDHGSARPKETSRWMRVGKSHGLRGFFR